MDTRILESLITRLDEKHGIYSAIRIEKGNTYESYIADDPTVEFCHISNQSESEVIERFEYFIGLEEFPGSSKVNLIEKRERYMGYIKEIDDQLKEL